MSTETSRLQSKLPFGRDRTSPGGRGQCCLPIRNPQKRPATRPGDEGQSHRSEPRGQKQSQGTATDRTLLPALGTAADIAICHECRPRGTLGGTGLPLTCRPWRVWPAVGALMVRRSLKDLPERDQGPCARTGMPERHPTAPWPILITQRAATLVLPLSRPLQRGLLFRIKSQGAPLKVRTNCFFLSRFHINSS